MNRNELEKLLARVQSGETPVDAAVAKLSMLPFVDTGSARIDTHRALRHGIPEVVFGLNKSAGQIAEIARALIDAG